MNKMFSSAKAYLPAADHDWLSPLVRSVVKLLGAEIARRALLDQAGRRVLNIGCGTGTFATLIKEFHPDVDIVVLDPDPKALARAQRKSERSAIPIRFDQGFADELGQRTQNGK